jgi:sugar porter (SP) family MFS transporter
MAKEEIKRRFRAGKVYLLTLNTMIAGYMFGYNIGVFNTSMYYVAHTLNWGNSTTAMISFCGAIMPAGGFIGGMSSSVISMKYGRRKAMMIADLIGFLGSGITLLPHTSTFAIGRFMSGIMVGLLSSVSSTYMSEISPSEIRGKTGSFFQLLRLVGLTSAYALGLGLPLKVTDPLNDWWRLMFGYPAVLNAIQGLLFLFVFKLESPYWLIKNGKSDEAIAVLNDLYVYDVDKVYDTISTVKADPLDSEISGSYFMKIWKMFSIPKVSKMLRLGLILGIFQPLSGNSAVAGYSTMFFTEMTGDPQRAREFTVVIGVVGIVSAFVAMQLIEKFGRKSLLIIGSLGMLVSNLLIGAFLISELPSAYPALVFIYFSVFHFNISIGPVLLPYISEIGTPLVSSLCVGLLWLGYLLVGICTPYAIQGFGPGPLFLIFMGLCMAGFLYILFDVVETKGMTKEDIRKIIVRPTENEMDAETVRSLNSPTSSANENREIESDDVKRSRKLRVDTCPGSPQEPNHSEEWSP